MPGQVTRRGRKLARNLGNNALVRVNCTRLLRQLHNAEMVNRIDSAPHRVWVTTAYFVPNPIIVTALVQASKRGCDVCILLPGKTDISLVTWVSRTFYRGLMKFGVRIFEYQPEVLSAKTLLIDDSWASVGPARVQLYLDSL